MHHALLVRRNRTDEELAFYRTWSPTPVSLQTLVTVAGRRWTIEEAFQSSKGLTGLDTHQVRRWTSWRRWTVLAVLAHAILTVLAVTAVSTSSTPSSTSLEHGHHHSADEPGLIPLTRNEIQRLIAALTAPVRRVEHALNWSFRRRRKSSPRPRQPLQAASPHRQMITKSCSSIGRAGRR